MPNLTSFAQIGLAIMFTTHSCVKHRILHDTYNDSKSKYIQQYFLQIFLEI